MNITEIKDFDLECVGVYKKSKILEKINNLISQKDVMKQVVEHSSGGVLRITTCGCNFDLFGSIAFYKEFNFGGYIMELNTDAPSNMTCFKYHKLKNRDNNFKNLLINYSKTHNDWKFKMLTGGENGFDLIGAEYELFRKYYKI